jgi:hypothetical protein
MERGWGKLWGVSSDSNSGKLRNRKEIQRTGRLSHKASATIR